MTAKQLQTLDMKVIFTPTYVSVYLTCQTDMKAFMSQKRLPLQIDPEVKKPCLSF